MLLAVHAHGIQASVVDSFHCARSKAFHSALFTCVRTETLASVLKLKVTDVNAYVAANFIDRNFTTGTTWVVAMTSYNSGGQKNDQYQNLSGGVRAGL